MHFEIRHVFDAPRETVEKALLDPDYLPFLLERHGTVLEIEPKRREVNNGRVNRTVRYLPKPVIESIGPKRVPSHWFAFFEESTFDPNAHRLDFSNVPVSDQIRKLLINKGTITFHDRGQNKTERVTSGELRLALPFILKPLAAIAERLIHSEAIKLLDREAEVMREWLAKKNN